MKLQSAKASLNGHSMVGSLKQVLVCSPSHAGWSRPESAQQWQDLGFQHSPNAGIAASQHAAMCEHLQAGNAELFTLPPSADLTLDAVYAHDASLPTDFGVIVLRPGKPNRIIEAQRQKEFFEQIGIPLLGELLEPATGEAGDMVWLDPKTLLVGRGYRTNAAGIEQLRKLLNPKGVKVVPAPLPYGRGPSCCLHLMSLISLLDERTALVDLPWLAVETVDLLDARRYSLIEIDSNERDTLACNVLSLGDRRLLALGENRRTNDRLRQAGFDVKTFPGSELCINGSGGPTCLTRPLLRL